MKSDKKWTEDVANVLRHCAKTVAEKYSLQNMANELERIADYTEEMNAQIAAKDAEMEARTNAYVEQMKWRDARSKQQDEDFARLAEEKDALTIDLARHSGCRCCTKQLSTILCCSIGANGACQNFEYRPPAKQAKE